MNSSLLTMKFQSLSTVRSGFFFKEHSQTTATRKPCRESSRSVFTSRATFLSNFSFQNAEWDLGRVVIEHPCWCQKQPFTKTTTLYRSTKMSGLPGRSRRCKRKRKPFPNSAFRTRISGFVSLEWTARIISERVIGSFLRMNLQVLVELGKGGHEIRRNPDGRDAERDDAENPPADEA